MGEVVFVCSFGKRSLRSASLISSPFFEKWWPPLLESCPCGENTLKTLKKKHTHKRIIQSIP